MITNIIGILIFIIFVYIILKLQKNKIPFLKKTHRLNKMKKNKKSKKNKTIKIKKEKPIQIQITEEIPQEMIKKYKQDKPIEIKPKKDNNLVYIEVEINGVVMGKIIIKLFDKIVPKTCNNFRKLCETKKYIKSIPIINPIIKYI